MISLSIIIPVYNGELFIKKCLDSIFTSDAPLELFEVIIVNDGTPDKSMTIISEYAEKYANIIVFSQENKGLGEARNAGIQLTSGKYIWFVDNDDWLPAGSIKRICDFINTYNPEIFSFEYRYATGNRSTIKNKAVPKSIYSGKEFLHIQIVESPVWHYVINSAFLNDNNLRFQKENHEDALFTPTSFFLAKSVMYDDSINYVYNVRENSISTSFTALKQCFDTINASIGLSRFMTTYAKNRYDKIILSKYISISIRGIFYYWKQLNRTEKKMVSRSVPIRTFFKPLLYNLQFKGLFGLIIIKTQ